MKLTATLGEGPSTVVLAESRAVWIPISAAVMIAAVAPDPLWMEGQVVTPCTAPSAISNILGLPRCRSLVGVLAEAFVLVCGGFCLIGPGAGRARAGRLAQ